MKINWEKLNPEGFEKFCYHLLELNDFSNIQWHGTSGDDKGRDLVAGLPKTVSVSSEEIREALSEPVSAIVEAVKATLDRTPPELSADLVDRGIILAGGGALLKGLDKLLIKETGLPTNIAEDPLTAVARGAGKILEELDFYKDALIHSEYRT